MRRLVDSMSHPVLTVLPETTVRDALALAGQWQVRHVVVVQSGDLVGVACLCDLEDALPYDFVGAWMSRPAIAAGPHHSVEDAAQLMGRHAIGCLPVVQEGCVVGIVTRADLRRDHVEVELAANRCDSCGSSRHVQTLASAGDVRLCHPCRERALAPHPEDEIGDGD
jgi:predicted transcriptional regulator